MCKIRKISLIIGLGLCLSVTAQAGMIPLSQINEDNASGNVTHSDNSSVDTRDPVDISEISDIENRASIKYSHETEKTEASSTPTPIELKSEPGSIEMCLSALLGLGLYTTIARRRDLSFGLVPEWYHNGGPYQIGHSYAVSPVSLYSISASCFVQPCVLHENCTSRFERANSLVLIKSRFVTDLFIYRGPPELV